MNKGRVAALLLPLLAAAPPGAVRADDYHPLRALHRIEQRLDRLEDENRYLRDYIAIERLQSLYQHYIHIGANKAIVALFADRDDVEIELSNKGILKGRDAPRRYFLKAGTPQEITVDRVLLPAGGLILHTAVNPALEINRDGTRAKAVWLSPGITNLLPPNAAPIAAWNYGKYEMEYVKENGEWKFLAFRWHQMFLTPYSKGWVESNIEPGTIGSAVPADQPSAPDFFSPFRADQVNRFDPPPPEPYTD